MREPTAEQRASAELARVVFRDPHQRAKFDLMTKETASREPVRDDFTWLSPDARGAGDEFSRFESLTQRLASGSESMPGTPKNRADRADRVSLHGVDPREAIRALLHTRHRRD